MRILGLVLAFATSVVSFAADVSRPEPLPTFTSVPAPAPRIDITSFVFVRDSARPLAELCGRVTGVGAPVLVKLTVDYGTSQPAIYNVQAGAEGAFCAIVASYAGRAIAAFDLPGRAVASAPANVAAQVGR